MKKIGVIFVFLMVFVLGGRLYYFLTGDFSPSYLLSTSFSQEAPVPKELSSILNQSFSYLGQGNQIYAFLSEDKKYVLKLFKKDYLKRTAWIHIFPPIFPIRSLLLVEGESKEKRKKKLINGYTTAYLYTPEESGLLYFHPSKTDDPLLRTTLITRLKNSYEIDLNEFIFAVQINVVTTKQELSKLLDAGKIEEAKQRIQQLWSLYHSEYSKGIYDIDHNIFDNTGFYENKAIRQDVGKIVRDKEHINEDFIKRDLSKITNQRLNPWLHKHYPKYEKELLSS